ELWTKTLLMPAQTTELGYHFAAVVEKTTYWYGQNVLVDGGPGQTYPDEADATDYNLTVYLSSFKTPAWMRKAVVYQIFPDRFYNGNPKNDPVSGTRYGYLTVYKHKSWSELPIAGGYDFFGGDLQGIIDKLGYLHKLGINALYLNPIFLAPSNHKYDTSNYMQIDPEFGTLKTFKTLIADTKKLGMHVILDGVFNHTGSDSIYFNEYGRFPDVGAYQSKQSKYFPWYTFYNWPSSYQTFQGVDTLPQLSEIPAVQNFIFKKPGSVAQYWLSQGSSGWRLDSPDLKSDAWWRAFRTAIKARYPQSVIIGEYWQDALNWLLGNEWDGVINYQFRESVLDFFANGTGAQSPNAVDAQGFLSDEMGLLEQYPLPAIYASMNIVDSHDVDRILYDLGGNKRALRLVALFQMTWLGAPTVYYGDEAGLTGATDPDDRRTFPWSHQDTSLEGFYRKIIHIRLASNALTEGLVRPLLTNVAHRVVAYERLSGARHAIVLINDGSKADTVTVGTIGVKTGTVLHDVLNGNHAYTVGKGSKIAVRLNAMSGAVLED
ncbi:MAG TPA: glycoside hydrolase family 13 protein, partial [Chloroflexota bacterium]|nr:glycoside hydrolase family 13 protein [Chloroflexota bacterium]